MIAALKDTNVGLANRETIGESEIHAVMDNLANAIRAKDVDALMAHYAPDVLTFDLLPPLQYQGADAVRKRVSQWFSSFRGPIGLEMLNLSITAGDDVAFCSSLNGSTGTNKDGAKIEMWWRATNGFRKVDGKWLVTHGNSSEPFDTASGKALVDLKP
jgi:ketosteroid isomerase-like protein